MRLICWISLLITVALLLPCAWPQASTGRVSGTVRDQSGAVIPGVPAVLTSTVTNVKSSTRTNEVGFYVFPGITSGSYPLSVEAAGMQKFEATLTVQALQSVVIDPVLKPGQIATAVEVTAVSTLVTTDNAVLRSTLERERIDQLPINGRNVVSLASLLPGVEYERIFGSWNGTWEFVMDGAVETERASGHRQVSNSGELSEELLGSN